MRPMFALPHAACVRAVLAALCLLVAAGLFAGPAAAQAVRVVASVDQTSPTTDDDVRYDVEVVGAPPSEVGQPRLPELAGLAPVSRFPTVTRVEGSGITPRVRFRWTLRPITAGRASIDEAFVSVGGALYASNPVNVAVRAGASMPQSGGTASSTAPDDPMHRATPRRSRLGDDDVFVRARILPSGAVWQGEQVVVEWRLYARPDLDLQYRITDPGDATGFWREDLPIGRSAAPSVVTLGGRSYSTLVVRRVALFPQQTGRLTIAPLRLEGTARVPLGARLFGFDNAPRIDETFTRSSDEVVVPVVARPAAPYDFSGLTGRVDLTADVGARTAAVGEGVEVTVTVRGNASLSTMPPPRLALADSVADVYDARSDSTRRAPGDRFSGTRTFRYTVVPRVEGTLALPAVEVIAFNPATRRYETERAALGSVRVTPGVAPPADARSERRRTAARDTDDAPTGRLPMPVLVGLLALGAVLMGAGALVAWRRRTPLAPEKSASRAARDATAARIAAAKAATKAEARERAGKRPPPPARRPPPAAGPPAPPAAPPPARPTAGHVPRSHAPARTAPVRPDERAAPRPAESRPAGRRRPRPRRRPRRLRPRPPRPRPRPHRPHRTPRRRRHRRAPRRGPRRRPRRSRRARGCPHAPQPTGKPALLARAAALRQPPRRRRKRPRPRPPPRPLTPDGALTPSGPGTRHVCGGLPGRGSCPHHRDAPGEGGILTRLPPLFAHPHVRRWNPSSSSPARPPETRVRAGSRSSAGRCSPARPKS